MCIRDSPPGERDVMATLSRSRRDCPRRPADVGGGRLGSRRPGAPAACRPRLSRSAAPRGWPGNEGLDALAGIVDPDHERPERRVLDHRQRGWVDHDPLVAVEMEPKGVGDEGLDDVGMAHERVRRVGPESLVPVPDGLRRPGGHGGEPLAVGKRRGRRVRLDDPPERILRELRERAARPAAVVDLAEPLVHVERGRGLAARDDRLGGLPASLERGRDDRGEGDGADSLAERRDLGAATLVEVEPRRPAAQDWSGEGRQPVAEEEDRGHADSGASAVDASISGAGAGASTASTAWPADSGASSPATGAASPIGAGSLPTAGGSASPSRSWPLHEAAGLVVTRTPPNREKPRSSRSGASAGRSAWLTSTCVPPKTERTCDSTRQPSGIATCVPPYIVRRWSVAPDGSIVAPRKSTSCPANQVITRPRRSAGAWLSNRSPAKTDAAVGSFEAGSFVVSMRRFVTAATAADPIPKRVEATTKSAKTRVSARSRRFTRAPPAPILLRTRPMAQGPRLEARGPGPGVRRPAPGAACRATSRRARAAGANDPPQSSRGRWTGAGGRSGQRGPCRGGRPAPGARPDGDRRRPRALPGRQRRERGDRRRAAWRTSGVRRCDRRGRHGERGARRARRRGDRPQRSRGDRPSHGCRPDRGRSARREPHRGGRRGERRGEPAARGVRPREARPRAARRRARLPGAVSYTH